MKLFLLRTGFSNLYNVSAQTLMTSFKGTFVNKLFTSKDERKVTLVFRCFNSSTNLNESLTMYLEKNCKTGSYKLFKNFPNACWGDPTIGIIALKSVYPFYVILTNRIESTDLQNSNVSCVIFLLFNSSFKKITNRLFYFSCSIIFFNWSKRLKLSFSL